MADDRTRPTPRDLAWLRRPSDIVRPPRRRKARPQVVAPAAAPDAVEADTAVLESLMRASCGDLPWLLSQLGLELPQSLGIWVRKVGGDARLLLDGDTEPQAVVDLWRSRVRPSTELRLIELLVFERWFSHRCSDVAPSLPGGFSFDKTLHVCRLKIGTALHDHARDINWRRPYVFTRTLRLAREYFRAGLAGRHLVNEGSRRQYEGKLGVATVLLSRFETCADSDLIEAIDRLRQSIESGNSRAEATPYVIEAILRRHDLTGDRQLLVEGIQYAEQLDATESSTACHLIVAELWLRLAAAAETGTGARRFLDRAAERLRWASTLRLTDPVERITHRVLQVLATGAGSSTSIEQLRRIRGLSIPFGLAVHADALGSGPEGDGLLAPVTDALRDLLRATSGEPLCRRILAELLTAAAALPSTIPTDKIALLEEAEEVHHGLANTKALGDEPSWLRSVQNRLELADLTSRPARRTDATIALVGEAMRSINSCYSLVLLARNVEIHGGLQPSAMTEVNRKLGSHLLCRPWLQALQDGDANALYRAAAERALGSSDLRRRHLGGRSGVWTTEDHLGLSNETFAFKKTPAQCQNRDRARTDILSRHLAETGSEERFGIIEHIAEVPDPESDGSGEPVVLTTRRYERGEILAERCRHRPERALPLIGAAAEYLALIQALEHGEAAGPNSGRKEIKKAELGRWLKVIFPEGEHLPVFQAWWELVADLAQLPRRDAHPFNWIVTADNRVLAVDLEAAGRRPVGYELAQLTDDLSLLPMSEQGWADRTAIAELYHRALESRGSDCSVAEVTRGYRAGLAARAVRALTDPSGDHGLRRHGEALLARLGADSTDPPVQAWARSVTRGWFKRRGVSEADTVADTTDGRRRHVSRALAYHLRHDPAAGVDRHGWVDASHLASLLDASGLAATESEVIGVAGALHEVRFDVLDNRIRARYGHSLAVDIDHPAPQDRPELFHVTSIDSLNAIFTRAEGLRPMNRQWVHLSSSWGAAMRTGRRKVGPVLLRLPPEVGDDIDVRSAGGTTWLAASVEASLVEVVPIYQTYCRYLRGEESDI